MYENHRTALPVLVCVLSFLFFSMLGCSGSGSDDNTTAPHGKTNNVNLTIKLPGPGQGLTQPAPGKHSVVPETAVEVLVSPKAGYVFSGWELSGDGSIDDPDAPVTTVTLSGDAVLMPQLKPEVQMKIQVSPQSCGSTVPMSEKTHSLGRGDTVDLSAEPGTGYYFVEWQADNGCNIADLMASSTTVTVSRDCGVTAQFEEDPVKFSGIVTATAYTSTDSDEETTRAKLSWLEAVSSFSASPGEIIYHVYHAESSDLAILYRSDHLVASLPGVLETEIEIEPGEKETYFLVVAADLQGNRNHSRKVVSVVPCQMVFKGGMPPMDLKEVGADKITVSGAEKIVTLYGGDWRFLFPSGKTIIVYGDGADLLKNVLSVRFDGLSTAIHYKDTQLGQVVKSGRFRTSTTFPDLSQLPVQSWQTVSDRADLPDVFIRELESLDRANSSVYVNPAGTVLVTESRADGATPSKDGRFEGTIPMGNLGKFRYLFDVELGVEDDLKRNWYGYGKVEYFKVVIKGKIRIQGVAEILLDSAADEAWIKEDLMKKKVQLLLWVGPIPIVQEFEFWVDAKLFVDISKESDFKAEVGVKLEKTINIGFEYRPEWPEPGWKTISNSEKQIEIPFSLSGSASTHTTLHLTPHFRVCFEKSATAEASLFSRSRLHADFNANNTLNDLGFYLTRFDVNSDAEMKMECDFSPFGQILAYHYDSWVLFKSELYSLPELKIDNFLPETIYVDKETQPHYLPAVVSAEFVDGINNGLKHLWWKTQKLMPDGQMWESLQDSRLLLSDEIVHQASDISKPPLFVFDQYTDLSVDRLFKTGLYRIVLMGTTKGYLGDLDTRLGEARFRVYSEFEPDTE